MTNHREWLTGLRESSVPYVLLGDEGKLSVKGEGELLLQGEYGELKLENVLLVEKLSLNLISQTQLDSTGCKTFSDKGKLWVFNEDWKVVAEGNRNQGLYEMKLRKKGLEDENATYLPSLEGDLAREELKARLGGLPVKELQQEASAMVVGMEKVKLETLHRRMGHASMDRVKELVKKGMVKGKVTITRDVVFYEEVNYLQWKGIEKEIAAAGTATAPDKVEDLLEEKESEGVGDEGDEELEDVERADSVDWVWEKVPTSEADETNGVEIAGEQPSNEVAEGGNDEVAGEEGDEESAAEGDSDPWKLLDSEDSNVKMRGIADLLKEGAIIIGREVKSGDENEKAKEDLSGDEAESPTEELGKGKRVKKPNPRYAQLLMTCWKDIHTHLLLSATATDLVSNEGKKFHRDLPDTKVHACGASRSSHVPLPFRFFPLPNPSRPPPTPPAQCEQKFHRDLPNTKVYAYGASRSSARYPGPVLVATRGTTTKVWPFLNVRRAMHRIRMVNAANARTYNLPIGSDGGYLARPLRRSSLLVFPATRHDLLLDFNAAPGWCRDIIIVNSANIPFPRGQPPDWFTGVVMRFIINQEPPVKPPPLPETLSHIPPVDLSQAVKQRFLAVVFVIDKALHEPTAMLLDGKHYMDPATEKPRVVSKHRLPEAVEQRFLAIGFVIDKVSQKPSAMLLDGKTYMDPATEKPKVGTSELWHIVNPSFEAHPIHLHLIQHRPISRRSIDSGGLINGSCSLDPASSKPSCFTGPARPVPLHERGWKDTTVAWPDSVLTVFVPFKGQVRCGAVWWGGRWLGGRTPLLHSQLVFAA
ncbi:unnamed protein product [Closterium sp. NIES-65]|nr:unnamed protein product [Closterium sp. NIES-65]